MNQGLALVSAAPISDAERTHHRRDLRRRPDEPLLRHRRPERRTRSAVLGRARRRRDRRVSTILAADGTRIVDQALPETANVSKTGTPFDGADDGRRHRIPGPHRSDPQRSEQGGRRPLVRHADGGRSTTSSTTSPSRSLLWGLLAAIIALALAVPVVQRISNTIGQRAKQVSDAAKELGVAIVGSEVSGDHVAATKAAVEKQRRPHRRTWPTPAMRPARSPS